MKINSLYLLAIFSLAITGCQNSGLENEKSFDDGIINYAVASGRSADTKAADESVGTVLMLSDKSGNLTIPMESEVSEGISLSSESVVTKGTQVNTTGDDYKTLETFADIVGTFEAKAYDSNGSEKVSQTVTWSGSSNAWIGSPVTYWPQATSLNFLAYANLPSEQSAAIASTGVSTSHTVPATAADQTDILFGYYQGNGGNTGTAEIRFEHPLTAVRFKYGTMDGNPIIKSISIDGVAESGTATMAPDGEISWNGVDSHDYAVSQEGDATTGLPVDATTNVIGEPFLIIPQKLTDNAINITVTFTDGIEVVAKLNTGEWKAGYTNTYTLGLSDTVDLEVADDVSNGVKSNVVIKNIGNTRCYIRAALIANWFDSHGIIVSPWSYDASNPASAGFDSLPSDASGSGARWIYNAGDGFYYFTSPVSPDEATSPSLFNSFTSTGTPPVEGSHLEMMVMAQGVSYDFHQIKVTAAWGSTVTEYLSK